MSDNFKIARTLCNSIDQVLKELKLKITKNQILSLLKGWGRTDFDYGVNQAVQRKVDVPIIDFKKCQDLLRMTRLERSFRLHPGFMCAGENFYKH